MRKEYRSIRLWSLAMLLAVVLAAPSGCGGGTAPRGVMSDSVFVEVMADLIAMKNPLGADTTYYAEQRRQVMARHQVSLEDLEAKGEALAAQPNRATAVWGQIRLKLVPSLEGG